MKSRILILAMLVTGLLMSGTGAGLAVSGLGATGNASQAQYPCDEKPDQPKCQTTTTAPTTTTGPRTTPPVPCDRNDDGRVDENEDMNGAAPGCEMDDGSRLPTSVRSVQCDEDGNGVISPSEAARNNCGRVASETDSGEDPIVAPGDEPTSRENAAQPARQVEASSDDELPFTGFAAIPILVGGVALLGGGLVLRRRTT